MFKIFSAVIVFCLTFIFLTFSFGLRMGPGIDTFLKSDFAFSQTYLFDLVTDIEGYVNIKNNIENIEIIERKGNEVIKWKENYKNGLWREYEVLTNVRPYIFSYKIVGSSNFHNAVVEYTFEEIGDFTNILLTEKGYIDQVFRRGLRFISGDDSYLKSQIKWLRVFIHQEMLNRS